MKKVGRVFSTIFLIFAIVVVVYVAYVVIQSKKTGKEVFVVGYKPYIILTGSMEPTIKQYGLVIVKKGDFNSVKIGDIISFDEPGVQRHVCHRVIAIDDNGLITTKGDNNNSEDLGNVSESNFIGKVIWHNNYIAYYYNVYQSPYGVWKAVVLPVVVIILIIVGVHLLKKREKKERNIRSNIKEEVQEDKNIEEAEETSVKNKRRKSRAKGKGKHAE
ncbi:MAG: signal peptidase I [Firmicutes bacterium]|nr:signal peptidase I [Bacillota bacterium]